MDPYSQQHDPNLIIQAAEEKRSAGDLSGANLLFESALLEWGDEAREGIGGEPLRDALANLWLAYADFHRSNKAWKSAMDTYEQAINDPISGTSAGRVFLEYARFAEERDKLVTAQRVYLRALVGDGLPAVTDEQDTTLLWSEFLEMMRKTKPSLTLASLKEVVQKEHLQKQAKPEEVSSVSEPSSKRARHEGETKTHVVTADDVDAERNELLLLISQMPPEISAAWMARDGDAPPQAPEHPLFSPTRPKMPDASGRDLIGDAMALRVTERLLSASGTVLLETCRALWLTTALTEKQSSQALDSLDKSMMKELKTLEASHHSRLSVAGTASAAVQMMNDKERKGFENACSQRRQDVLSRYAWEFRNLLCIQQIILTKLAVPGFDGPTVDARALEFQSHICTLLHTAFFLRKNLGEERHNKMLETQQARLIKDRDNYSPDTGARTPPRTMSPVPPPGIGQPMFTSQPLPMYGLPPQPLGNFVVPPGYRPPPPPPPNMMQHPPHMMMPPGGHYTGPPQPPYHQ